MVVPDCIEGIHKRETVLQLMQRVEQATGVCCVKRSAQVTSPRSFNVNAFHMRCLTLTAR